MSDIRSFHDFEEGKFIFGRTQDVEPYLERNKKLQNEAPRRAETFRHVGTIPAIFIEKWLNEEGAPIFEMNKREFARFIKRKLNDPDWRFLKTSPGTI